MNSFLGNFWRLFTGHAGGDFKMLKTTKCKISRFGQIDLPFALFDPTRYIFSRPLPTPFSLFSSIRQLRVKCVLPRCIQIGH